jgi:hypothetical protein
VSIHIVETISIFTHCTVHNEIQSHNVEILPYGQMAGNWMKPRIEAAYRTGKMPPLLPAPGRVQ